jgi:hypothetical protein
MKVSEMSPTDDPSIFEYEGRFYHVPGSFGPKLAYLLLGVAVLIVGIWFAWEPASRVLFGHTASARVVRIVKITPGAEDQVIRYRREFKNENDRSVTFQHWVEVQDRGERRILRLSVDSRVKPYANVNDRVTVSFSKGDTFAFETWQARTWGVAILYAFVGFVFVCLGLPMLLAVGKPIEIDPEAKE